MEIKLFSSSSHGKCLISNISFEFLNKSCDIKEQLPFLLVMGRVGVLGEGKVAWRKWERAITRIIYKKKERKKCSKTLS